MLVDTRAASTVLNLKWKGVMDKQLPLLSTTKICLVLCECLILPPLRCALLYSISRSQAAKYSRKLRRKIPFLTVPKMMVSDLIDIWVGGVGNFNKLPVVKVGKKVPIGLSPLLCFGGFLGWHGAVIWR